MARGRGQQLKSAGDRDVGSDVKVCPLCIEPLDTDEQQFYPCPCGYQVCLFCYEKLKLFCNNLCPGCRTEYGSQKDPHDPMIRQPPTLAEAVTAKQVAQPHPGHLPAQPRGTVKGDQPGPSWPAPTWGQHTDEQPPLLSANAADPTSAWPSLAASQRQAQPHPHASTSQQPSAALHREASEPVQEAAIARQSGKQITVTLPAPLDARQEPSVQADPEGAALLRTVQSAVGNGHLSIEEGTKQLVAFLRQREQAQGSSKPGGKASKPPPGFAGAVSQPPHPASEPPTLLQTAQQVLDPHPLTASTSSSEALLPATQSFQQWSAGGALRQPPLSPSGKAASNAAFAFPVDMVAASAALWLAPVASDSKQLLSLRLHGQKDPPMLRRRRGPLYARTGNMKVGTSDQQPAKSSDGKLSAQQAQWIGLGNGLAGQSSGHLHSRNGYSPIGFQNGPGQREYANGLPGNGNTSANTSSHAA